MDEDNQEIVVSDMDPKAFKAMMHYIYRDKLVEDELAESCSSSDCVGDALTAKLLAAADRYDLGRLRQMCESYLCKDISIESISQILALADRYHATELKSVCLGFAAENLAGLWKIIRAKDHHRCWVAAPWKSITKNRRTIRTVESLEGKIHISYSQYAKH